VSIDVLVADDQALVRTGLRMILEVEPDIRVVGEAVDGVDAVTLTARLHPDVVVMDIRMPRLDGVGATRQIVSGPELAGPRVLIVTTFDEDRLLSEALRAGASGFLLKNAPAEQMVEAVRAVAVGEGWLSPEVTRRVIEGFAGTAAAPPDPATSARVATLTDREREVLALVARGWTNQEIADQFVVSAGTVKTHVARLLAKLEVRDRVAAVVVAYESGFVRPGDER
jgi:DNA-binding NarL/FixJ family response regulator